MSDRTIFTADLSPGDLALCRYLGARPVAQVMGACVYGIGVSGAPVLGDPGYREYYGTQGPVMFELRRISRAYDYARRAACGRLIEHAARVSAHIVVGVELTLTEGEAGGTPTVEYLATGTALRLVGEPSTRAPRLTSLSVAGWWLLRQAGCEPVGIAAATTILYARRSYATTQALRRRGRSAPPNRELAEFSAAATAARRLCHDRMLDEAHRLGGTGIVGISLELSHSIGVGLRGEAADTGARAAGGRYGNLHLTVHGRGIVVGHAAGGRADVPAARSRPVLFL